MPRSKTTDFSVPKFSPWLLWPLLLCLTGCSLALRAEPELPTHLARMPVVTVLVDAAPAALFQARLAATPWERALGFQHVPVAILETQAILFLFPEPLRPAFHMRNVSAPLAIAWIDVDGHILQVDIMQPDGIYEAPAKIQAALEVGARHPLAPFLTPGVRLSWQPG